MTPRLKEWPAPYLQPDPHRDCHLYATAYVARCLGKPDATAEAVRALFDSGKREEVYPERETGAPMRAYWREAGGYKNKVWWLGPHAERWVRFWLRRGWVGLAHIHRIPDMTHCVALLEADDDGVLIMDPIYGFKREPWAFFLGPGAGRHGLVHRIDAWYEVGA